jgi:uncharacterized damage-inducible protein DinB
MKRGLVLVMGTIAVMTMAGNAQGQGRGGAPVCTTVACDVLGDWGRNYGLLIGEAEAMPEDKYGFKPTPPQQTFGERLMHVATIDVKILSTLGGKTPAPMVNPKAATKTEILAALRQVNDYGAAVLKEFNDQQLNDRVASLPFLGPTASRLRVINFSMSHSQDIYGQLAVYLRLSGITPPASNRP